LKRSPVMLPIPGTGKVAHLEENVGAAAIKLSDDEFATLDRAGAQIDKDELLGMFTGKVAKWWLPDDVLMLEELPHTATGKLNKLALRARYQDHLIESAKTQGQAR
jgi:acyl-CoA synthetase (AMP-forming)/AMP-acid ligase II